MLLNEGEAGWTLTRQVEPTFAGSFPTVVIGGMPIAALSIDETVSVMLKAVRERPRGHRPLYMTSANGEVIARYHDEPAVAALFDKADLINADGQPMVIASRLLSDQPLPERVATTDLFDAVAAKAVASGTTFYLFGATEEENQRAADVACARHPGLRIVGRCHGYLQGDELARKIAEIDSMAPDILWLGLGVPREQAFCVAWSSHLRNVGIIKTSGGLFNFISGKNARAPKWMQALGLEWAWRIWLEPRRLFWRYFRTNPRAMLLMLRHSS